MAMQNSDPNLTSKKRTRPSSSPGPLNGVFTRRKTQTYLHCNRSGRTRSDSFLYEKLQLNAAESISKRPRRSDLTLDSAADTDDDLSRILIRDLRMRRVFSPGSSIAKECEMAAVNEEMKKSSEGKEVSEGGFACVVMSDIFCVKDDVKVRENGEFEEPMNGSVLENVENLSGDVVVSKGNAFINNEDEGFPNEFGGLKEEECLQATPPDSDVLGCRIVDNEAMASKNSEQKANPNIEKIGVLQGNVEKKNGTSLETKFILSPCSRVRVFKAPGSFSYRRLLPFLVDMARENSYVERKINLENQQMPMDKSQADCYVAKSNNDVSAHLSQKSAFEEKQRIEVEESRKYHNLQNLSTECPSQRENLNSHSFNQAKPTDNKDAETANDELSCNDGLFLNSEKDLQNRDGEACKYADETRHMDCQQTKEFETGDPCISLCDKTEKKDDNDGGDLGKSADSNEEPIQVVQSDAETYDRAGVKENTNTGTECAIQSSNQLPQKPVYRSISSNNGSEHVKPVASNSKSKLGLSPCAKLKRLKTPSSFSYKRLFPYLMEISKDCSGDSGNTHSQDSREVNKPSTLLSEVCKFSAEEQNTNNSQEIQISTVTATSHASNSNRLNLMSAEQVTGTSMSFGSQEELKSINAVAKNEKQLNGASDIETSIHERNAPTMQLNAYVIPPKSSSCGSTDFVQQRLSTVGGSTKAVEVYGISQRSSQLDGSDSFRIAHCSRKSILKRSPRGCRGLCSCLNCASFRLHAERAFEFSKNQMQDAEEITLDLVRELSHLRNLLEKSAFSSDANSVVTCSNQVKEACHKASEAEALAKGRISQMIYDLNIHCRIPCSQPPRVTFAIDESVISNQSLEQKQ